MSHRRFTHFVGIGPNIKYHYFNVTEPILCVVNGSRCYNNNTKKKPIENSMESHFRLIYFQHEIEFIVRKLRVKTR